MYDISVTETFANDKHECHFKSFHVILKEQMPHEIQIPELNDAAFKLFIPSFTTSPNRHMIALP